MKPQTSNPYNILSKFLHWTVVLLLIGQFAIIWMSQLAFRTGPEFREFGASMIDLHKAMGLAVLGVAIIRLLWRWIGGLPKWANGLAEWEKKAAHALESWLYIFLFLLPLSGIGYSIASGYPILFFDYFQIPVLMERVGILATFAWFSHMLLGYTLVGVIALHIGFVARRSIFENDGYIRRMWF